MKDKIIELIRQCLLKTIVPFKKRVDQSLSQFHFSIAFRIAFYYVRLFVCYGIVFFVVVYAVYIKMEDMTYYNYASERVEALESGRVSLEYPHQDEKVAVYYYQDEGDYKGYTKEEDEQLIQRYREHSYREYMNPYSDNGVTMRIQNLDTKEIVYDDIADQIDENTMLFNKYSFNYQGNSKLIVKEAYLYEYEGKHYEAHFQYDITGAMNKLHQFILLLIILYMILVVFVAKFGRTGIERLLQPIKNMSAIANRLTVNNLHSERLNVEGTKNELKDLAATFNSMLDRIELSYESQKQFVSDASHELRTPIAVVQGYANMLGRWGSKDEEVLQESIEAISNEAKSMKDLVEKLLFLSRHDKKTLKLNKSYFNMKTIVEEMVKETKLVAIHRAIQAACLQDVMVYGDPQSLKQAVRIFIENAIKYSREGDSIFISCKNEAGTCIVSVEDTGRGMKKEDMDKIFDRFYRADDVRNGGVSGHGLGLSIAKLIVLKHAGSIKVRSQYKKGSSFSIVLPDYYRQGFFK